MDLTTGDFLTTEVEGDSALLTELERLRPAEIIYPGEAVVLRDLLQGGKGNSNVENEPLTRPAATLSPPERGEGSVASKSNFGWILNGYDDWTFAPETALFTVREHFKVASLDGFGLKDRTAAIGAAGARCITSRNTCGAT